MKRKGRNGGDDGGSWLNTYSDMVTLLLTFFVVLFSMSTVEQEKFDELVRSFLKETGTAPTFVIATSEDPESSGIAYNAGEDDFTTTESTLETNALPSNMDELYRYLKTYVEENNMESSVSISKENDIIYVRFSNNVLFEPDQYNLTGDSLHTLSFMGKGLKNMESQIRLIQICGHTADTKDPNYPVDDWQLSGERAASVARFFEKQEDITPSLLMTVGYGFTHPIDTNDTVQGRRNNRRAEIIIIGKDVKSSMDRELSGTYDSSSYPTIGGGLDLLLPPDTGTSQIPSESSPAAQGTDSVPESSESTDSEAHMAPSE